MRFWAVAVIACLGLAAPVQAGVVFTDNFDAEGGGFSVLNYNGFANFSVTGQVDLVKSGDFGIVAAGGTGSAVDLDGTSGPGELTSLLSYAFNAGDTVRLSYDLSGNQRGGPNDDWNSGFNFTGSLDVTNYGFNYSGTDTIIGDFFNITGISSSDSIAPSAPYATRSVFFTAVTAGVLNFFISTTSGDNFGPMLDNVSLDISPASNEIPEPGTLTLAGLGALGFIGGAIRRRRRTV